MKILKRLWNRVPKLPRKWKVLRNISVSAVLLLVALMLFDWPALTSRIAYRKLEDRLLLSPSEIVYAHKTSGKSVFLTEGEGWITAGNVTQSTVGNTPFKEYMACIQYLLSKEEGCLVLPLSGPTKDDELVVAVYGYPEDTVGAVMELDLFDVPPLWYGSHSRSDDETLSASAKAGENGWMFFTFAPHEHGNGLCALEAMWADMFSPWDAPVGYEYRLKFNDEQGNSLDSISGVLPENRIII